MANQRNVRGLNVVVLGLARQGLALSRWLAAQGAQVTASDVQPAEKLPDALRALEGLPIRLELGGHPLSLLDGCDLLCLSGGVPTDLPVVLEARRRGISLSNDSQLFVERCPATVMGITGSAGKTTTTTLVGEMCRVAGRKTWVGGNIGNPLIGDLDAIASSDLVVMELSSFQLELMTSSPPIAAVLNVTPNHLDRHPSMEAYTAAKAHILDYQSARDTAVLGFDDPVARSLARRVRGALWMFVGDGSRLPQDWSRLPHASVREGCVVLAQDRPPPATRPRPDGPGVGRRAGGRASPGVPVCLVSDIRLRGDHNLLNVLAACALASAAGIEPEAMRQAIIEFTGVAHRLQLVRVRNGVSYYDDSIATAPERLIAALKAFHEPIVLLAGGRDKHLPWDEAAGLIRQRVRRLILFGEMAGLVERAIGNWELGIGSSELEAVHRVNTLAEAVGKAAEVAQAGDVVLLSPGGTSFDAFQDFAERGDRFQEYVRQL